TAAGQTRLICPTSLGGKNWHAGTYSPQTQAMYYSLANTCAEMTSRSDTPSLDDLYAISTRSQIAPGTDNVGTIQAISAVTGETLWKYEQRAGTTSLMSTASGLLFGGDVNGRFRAFDIRNGEILWEVNLGSGVTGFPATFAVDGRQYVAVSTGPSLNTFGLGQLTPELSLGAANNLFVFALPE
ncbi:MAG: PQQ-binding-like beta-propeller repeat protein, partial [Gammaproteobacteria bacterium]